MRDNQFQFLSLAGRLPARLTVEQTAWMLNCQPHDIPVLVSAKLLKPLGAPKSNATKYFAAAEVLEQSSDRAWLGRVTKTIADHWRSKNQRKASLSGAVDDASNELAAALRPLRNAS